MRVEYTFFNRYDFFIHFDVLNSFSYRRPVSCQCLFIITTQFFYFFFSSSDKQCSRLLIKKNLFRVIPTRIVYLFLITFFVDSHMKFFSWFNIFNILNKDGGIRSRITKVGKEFIVFIFFMFWMNLSASSYLCFLVIVRTLFLHFVEMNLIELALHLSCRCFHVWNRWRWGGDQIFFSLKVFFNIVAQSDDSNAWYGNQRDNFVFRKYSALMYLFYCFSSMHCLFEEYLNGFLWKNFFFISSKWEERCITSSK